MQKCKIKSIKHIGKKQTYNLTMKSDQHNYAIYDEKTGKSIISCNSHACSYGYTSYITAYLKANYPDEFVCSLLTVESERAHHDKMVHFENDFKGKLDIKFLERDINRCKVPYTIEKKKDLSNKISKTEIRPSLLCKGMGIVAATQIELNQPYKGLRDVAMKTNPAVVDAKAIFALAENGYFGKKIIKKKDEFVAEFVQIRKDLKAVANKGTESLDIFG